MNESISSQILAKVSPAKRWSSEVARSPDFPKLPPLQFKVAMASLEIVHGRAEQEFTLDELYEYLINENDGAAPKHFRGSINACLHEIEFKTLSIGKGWRLVAEHRRGRGNKSKFFWRVI